MDKTERDFNKLLDDHCEDTYTGQEYQEGLKEYREDRETMTDKEIRSEL